MTEGRDVADWMHLPERRQGAIIRPRLLDLFCCAGGASMGYHRAGFEVVGADLSDQPRYPFEFIHGDWRAVLDKFGDTFDAVHASPPCQGYSAMSTCRPGLADQYLRLIEPVREALKDLGVPYAIENVEGSPLDNPIMLCGQMFGLELYRHRLFECSFPVAVPTHPRHVVPASKAGHWVPGTIMSVAGHMDPVAHARRIMGIDWTTREELAEAIPPAYTEFIGSALLAHITTSEVAA